jgi:hypothetical protein
MGLKRIRDVIPYYRSALLLGVVEEAVGSEAEP